MTMLESELEKARRLRDEAQWRYNEIRTRPPMRGRYVNTKLIHRYRDDLMKLEGYVIDLEREIDAL